MILLLPGPAQKTADDKETPSRNLTGGSVDITGIGVDATV